MTSGSGHGRGDPGKTLFAGLHRIDPGTIGEVHAEPADFADRISCTLEQVRSILDDPVRAVMPTGLFIRREEQRDGTTGREVRELPLAHHGEDHPHHVFHIHRSAAPDHTFVVDVPGERRVGPATIHRRYHVEMAREQQRRKVRVGALQQGRDPRTM